MCLQTAHRKHGAHVTMFSLVTSLYLDLPSKDNDIKKNVRNNGRLILFTVL